LREQRHGVDIAAFRGFLGPQRGLLAVAGAEVRIGKIILGTGITGFSLFLYWLPISSARTSDVKNNNRKNGFMDSYHLGTRRAV
jgi:hypothetical protein